MKNWLKIIVPAVMILMFVISSPTVCAAEIDASKNVSLTIEITDPENGLNIPYDAEIALYKIAELEKKDTGQSYVLLSRYKSLEIDFTDLNAEKEIAIVNQLLKFINAEGISPLVSKNNSNGKFEFENLGVGIYLVVYKGLESANPAVDPFMVTLPVWDEKNESWIYDAIVYPKTGVVTKNPNPPGQYLETETETEIETETSSEKKKPKDKPTPLTPGGKLPQTGMLQWPIPVLTVVGVLLLCQGWMQERTKRRKRPAIIMAGGTLLVCTAAVLLSYNVISDKQAGNAAAKDVTELMERIPKQDSWAGYIPEINNKSDQNQNRDGAEMKPVVIAGHEYIGVLSIPKINISLPIFKNWNYTNLRISPCRYTGNYQDDSMIIAAHNYSSHFGNINELNTGDEVRFTDAAGKML